MAAHDTTTITMSSMAYHLAKNPEWQEQGAGRVGGGRRSRLRRRARARRARPGDEGVDAAVLAGALAPPGGGARTPRSTGYHIPAGSFVTVSPYMNHYLPELWPDPDALRPRPVRARAARGPLAPAGLRAVRRRACTSASGCTSPGCRCARSSTSCCAATAGRCPPTTSWPIDLTALPFPRDGVPVHLEQALMTDRDPRRRPQRLRAVRRPPGQRRGRRPGRRGQPQHALPRLPQQGGAARGGAARSSSTTSSPSSTGSPPDLPPREAVVECFTQGMRPDPRDPAAGPARRDRARPDHRRRRRLAQLAGPRLGRPRRRHPAPRPARPCPTTSCSTVAELMLRVAWTYLLNPRGGLDVTDEKAVRDYARRYLAPAASSEAASFGPSVRFRARLAARCGVRSRTIRSVREIVTSSWATAGSDRGGEGLGVVVGRARVRRGARSRSPAGRRRRCPGTRPSRRRGRRRRGG